MKYYAVIDTNVIVSAMLKKDSVPGKIIELCFNGMIIPMFNDDILNEYKDVLYRPKFNFGSDIIEEIVGTIRNIGIFVKAEPVNEILSDPKDTVFYEIVMEKKDDGAYLVTGNIKHFPVKPFIVTPREFLDIITYNQKFPLA